MDLLNAFRLVNITILGLNIMLSFSLLKHAVLSDLSQNPQLIRTARTLVLLFTTLFVTSTLSYLLILGSILEVFDPYSRSVASNIHFMISDSLLLMAIIAFWTIQNSKD